MRTFAMRVYAATYWVLAVDFVYILVVLILPLLATQPDAAGFLPLVLVFLVLFVIAAALATAWRSAPRRAWFWLVAAVPSVLFLLLNAPFLPFALSHPIDTQGFTAILPLTVGAGVIVVSGILAFQQARAGAAPATPSLRAVVLVAVIIAVTAGAMATSFLAGATAGSGGGSAAAEVSSSVILDAKGTTYVEKTLTAQNGQVLGVVVVNHDGFAHTFDIDALNIHVPLPANSSTFVAVKPIASGTLEFYCSIPGHKAAGMDGTIEVH